MTTPNPLPGPMPPDALLALPHMLQRLASPAEFGSVVHTVRDNNPGMAETLARRIAAEGLKFVGTAARFPEAGIAPSPVVDEGWHAWVLDTQLYERVANDLGAFVHHKPERPGDSDFDPDLIERTIATMAAAGYPADLELWAGPSDVAIPVAAQTWHTPVPGPNCSPIVIIPKPKPSTTPVSP